MYLLYTYIYIGDPCIISGALERCTRSCCINASTAHTHSPSGFVSITAIGLYIYT